MPDSALATRVLSVFAGARTLLRDVTMEVQPRQVFGIIGPSGAGKSTLLKSLNRLIELTPGLTVRGDVLLRGQSIFGLGDVDALRARVGMIFQQPVVFPTSIYQNVIFGARRLGKIPKKAWPEKAELALREAALWDEVKDRLREPALRLSVGQQQRLCLARALAADPEVLLMDEPTSALDAKSTEAVEELIRQLKRERAVILVTHNLGQARRLADQLACISPRNGAGEIVESGPCAEILGHPRTDEAADFFQSRERLENSGNTHLSTPHT